MERFLKGLARPSTYLPLVLAAIAFAVLVPFVGPQTLTLIISGVDIAVWLIVMTVYAPILVKSLRSPNKSRDEYLVTGIVLMWSFISLSRLWFITAVLLDRPKWMPDFWFPTFCYFMIAVSGYYFVKVPGGYDGKSGWRYVTLTGVLAVLIVTGALVYLNTYVLSQ